MNRRDFLKAAGMVAVAATMPFHASGRRQPLFVAWWEADMINVGEGNCALPDSGGD
jgi:hypothetical protein